MQAPYRRFASLWLTGTLLGLAAIAGFNILVDPLGMFPDWHLKRFEPLRFLESDRVAKAEMARRGDWQTVILGSSRAQIGFPARHPALPANRTCNLSLAAARLPEVVAEFDFARRFNPLKQVILCLDLYMFCEGPEWKQDFQESRFSPGFNPLSYYCKHLLGRAATDGSWEALRRQLRHYQPVPQAAFGFFHFELGPRFSQRTLFDRMLRVHGHDYPALKLDPSKPALLRHVVRVCRDEHIDLRLAIMPPHALDLEVLHASGRWAEFEKWKTQLVDLLAEEGVEGKVSLWDFSGYAGPPSEALPPAGDPTNRTCFYLESSHFLPTVGSLILDAMFSSGGANSFGVKLDRTNLKAHLARILADRAEYTRTNTAEIQYVQRILESADTGKDPD
jgi:hypothetical protein